MTQKYTEARKAANRKWDSQNLDRVNLALPKGYREKLQEVAAERGLSVNAYVRQLIDDALAAAPAGAATAKAEGAK